MSYQYDTIILGAGSGGLTAYMALSSIGKKVLLVEKDKMGGECTNTGCIPSKSLIHQAKKYREGIEIHGRSNEMEVFRKNALSAVRNMVKHIRDEEEPEPLIEKYKNSVVRGTGSLIDKHTVKVVREQHTKRYTAKTIIIATGSRARTVPVEGLEQRNLLTNENVFDLKEIPEHLLILGGGPIGCELGQALTHLGTKVSIVNKRDYIMPRDEEECAKQTEEVFRSQGIQIFNNATIHEVKGRVAVIEQEVDGKKHKHSVDFQYLLQGVGRIPNLDDLNLKELGVKYNDRMIFVDKHYRTSVKNIYAIGDVSSQAKFTHTAEDQGRHIMKRMIFPWYPAETKKPVPHVTYLDQEVAGVGYTYSEAVEKYGKKNVVKVSVDFGVSDRAKTDEVTKGVLIAICAPLTGKIYGAHIMGKNAGEMIGVFTLAIQEKVSMYKLNKMIVPYPTLSQAIKFLTDEYLADSSENVKKYLPRIVGRWVLKGLVIGIILFFLTHIF
ncbi:MAG: NAD(P)/FAD-dependent oxidoreductase [Candidatus Gracilibacteria bacterium]|nr:NAD(P)/FAD-dependent oxidoreductase [Candidatus Gracilibacteria bacterium]